MKHKTPHLYLVFTHLQRRIEFNLVKELSSWWTMKDYKLLRLNYGFKYRFKGNMEVNLKTILNLVHFLNRSKF